MSNNPLIHPTAIIDSSAVIASDVTIGPYCIIGPNVTIGEGTKLHSHVVIGGYTRIGQHNEIFQFASVGEVCQDLKYAGEETWLEIASYIVTGKQIKYMKQIEELEKDKAEIGRAHV